MGICPAYTSKYNSTCEKQIILLMIPNKRKYWSKKLLALLEAITSKHDDDFYYLNCLHSFKTENELKYHEKACKINIFVEL